MHRQRVWFLVAVVCVVIVSVIPKAVSQVAQATARYAEQRKAILAGCEAERTKLGLTPEQAAKKYPTPEIALAPALKVAPNDAQAYEWKGPFRPGTKFLFTNDDVEVLKEQLTPTGYTATVRMASQVGPGPIAITAFNPVSCERISDGNALYVGGRWEWTMKTTDGWELRMKATDTREWSPDGKVPAYRLEFYRPGQPKLFEALETNMTVSGRTFRGELWWMGGDSDSADENLKAYQEELKDKDTDADRKAELQKEIAELKKQLETYGKKEVDCTGYRIFRQPSGGYGIELTCSGDPKFQKITGSGEIKRLGTT